MNKMNRELEECVDYSYKMAMTCITTMAVLAIIVVLFINLRINEIEEKRLAGNSTFNQTLLEERIEYPTLLGMQSFCERHGDLFTEYNQMNESEGNCVWNLENYPRKDVRYINGHWTFVDDSWFQRWKDRNE